MLSKQLAYPVPFAVDRSNAPRLYQIRNMGLEPVRSLRLMHIGSGYCPPLRVRMLAPGATLSIAVFGASATETGAVMVRWRRADDAEYLWRLDLSPFA